MRMRLGIAIGLVFTAVGISAEDALVVRGEVSLTESGFARISECGSNRVFQFGVMASSPYFIFVRRYEELSAHGKMPVLIEARGVVVRSDNSTNISTLEHPRVITLTQGTCDKRA
jgi:hypothetical protein